MVEENKDHYCIACNLLMKPQPRLGFDMGINLAPVPHYCNQEDCERYGLLSMVSIYR